MERHRAPTRPPSSSSSRRRIGAPRPRRRDAEPRPRPRAPRPGARGVPVLATVTAWRPAPTTTPPSPPREHQNAVPVANVTEHRRAKDHPGSRVVAATSSPWPCDAGRGDHGHPATSSSRRSSPNRHDRDPKPVNCKVEPFESLSTKTFTLLSSILVHTRRFMIYLFYACAVPSCRSICICIFSWCYGNVQLQFVIVVKLWYLRFVCGSCRCGPCLRAGRGIVVRSNIRSWDSSRHGYDVVRSSNSRSS